MQQNKQFYDEQYKSFNFSSFLKIFVQNVLCNFKNHYTQEDLKFFLVIHEFFGKSPKRSQFAFLHDIEEEERSVQKSSTFLRKEF